MNTRKFYLIITIAVSIFLFLAGVFMLYSLNIIKVDNASPLAKILDPFIPATEPVNILVLGGDKVAKNTDTMMLVNFNPSTAKLSILSIPRDTKTKIKGHGTQKINAAFPFGGPELALTTVSDLLDVKIKYYVYVDTSAFRKIIDELDGVDFYVPVDMDYDDPAQNLHIHLKKGQQKLYGAQAEQFMRFRQPNNHNYKKNGMINFYDGSDLKRIDAQQNFIKELIKQKANIYYITKLNSILGIVFNNIETNIGLDQALKLSRNISQLDSSSINMFKLPGDDKKESYGWYYVHDKEKTQEIIQQNFISNEEFGKIEDVKKVSNDDDEDYDNSKIKSSTKSNKDTKKTNPSNTTKDNFTKNNPSNAETSIKGTTKPNP
ncbi:MAG: LCP family protein [Clostridia bacterium]|nr:LCP family protein [Clostridia bacterium]